MYKFIYNIPTKVYFGKEQLENLKYEIKKYGVRVLLCYGGKSIKKNGLYNKIISELEREKIQYFELEGIESNPKIETVKKGALICKEKKIDLLLAVGGGSVIDCTKMIAAATYYDGDPWDLVIKKKKIEKALPIITVLTISATGSEMNSGSVISKIETGDKIGVSSSYIQPKVSFLDPTITFSVSKIQTAYGAVDILSHIIETYFNTKENMFMLDEIMEAMMRTIIKYVAIALEDPENEEARANLMWCSSWAINGFISSNQNCAWTCHLLEHQLSGYYDIPHGLGLAIIIPKWMRYILDEKNNDRFKRFACKVFNLKEEDEEVALKGIEKIENLFYKEMKIVDNLTKLGINENNFDKMAEKCLRAGYLNGYKRLNKEDIINIYKMCL